ncbi:alpha/beta hydrolase [Bacillus sp. ISL-75]|uniref:alpha/beta hydrolase n=1 Tax=Bacillus sp. ISL-75 TaxID=2819137 RepID=UPI001BE7E863|nr:alpha/beta hydrolase [Bacillus sp. ISL-75]MBT2730725.1 alpha/beta hydrolase [Bacillus sp. ISL-75]
MRKFTFELNEKVTRTEIRFTNRFGIELAGDLYLPKDEDDKKLPALVIGGPFGAVKEQASGRYANEMASFGFAALAFDGSYTGESGGTPRNVAAPDINTEDFMAAVDGIGLQSNIDRERISVIGICGWGSIALNAVSMDKRVKAIATVSMYDNSAGLGGLPLEQRTQLFESLSQQRWADAENGTFAPMADQLPAELPENPDMDTKETFEFYRTPRGFHDNSILSNGSWNATMPFSFMNTPVMNYIDEISPRPTLFIAGEHAFSKPLSEVAYEKAKEPKELLIVSDAWHATLYDNMKKIPFDKLEEFFTKNLK